MRSEPKVVLHCLGRLNRGGAELRTIELIEALQSSGHAYRHDVLVCSGETGALDDRFRATGGRVHYLRLRPFVLFVPGYLLLLSRLRPRVVHSNLSLFSGTLLFLAWLMRVPARQAHFRGTYGQDRPIYHTIQRFLLRRFATALYAVAPGAGRSHLPDWDLLPRARVVPNGLRFASYAPDIGARERIRRQIGLPADAHVIGHVGRLDPPKNHQRILSIFASAAADPRVHLLCVGKHDTESGELAKTVIAQLPAPIQARIHLVGPHDDIPAWLSAMDSFCFPSLHEGLPGAAIEAVFSGLTPVCSDLPGVRTVNEGLQGRCAVLSLDASDERWALELRAQAPSWETRTARHTALTGNPFDLASALPEFRAMFER